MSTPIVHGPAFSTYVRSVRLTLAEKGVEHDLQELDFVAGAHKEEPHLSRQPFGKVPAFVHDGETLYESIAVMRYVDEAFDGPSLQPDTALGRARMMQVISIVDAYGYTPSVAKLFIERVFKGMVGGEADEAIVAEATPAAAKFAGVLDGILGDQTWFAGAFSLADIHALPVLTYLAATPEGQTILESTPKLRHWMGRMNERAAVQAMMPRS